MKSIKQIPVKDSESESSGETGVSKGMKLDAQKCERQNWAVSFKVESLETKRVFSLDD